MQISMIHTVLIATKQDVSLHSSPELLENKENMVFAFNGPQIYIDWASCIVLHFAQYISVIVILENKSQ